MPIKQAYYTSSARGVVPGFKGFQFQAMTPGISEKTRRWLETLCRYQLPAVVNERLRASITAGSGWQDVVASSPVVFQYRKSPDGEGVVARIAYIGRDYSGRFGNIFAHFLLADSSELPSLRPVELWGSTLWQSAESEETELPELERRDIDARRTHLADSVEHLLASRERPRLERYLSAVVAAVVDPEHNKRILFLGASEEVIPWIAMADSILPPSLSENLTFTTYVVDPAGASDCAIGALPGDIDRSLSQSPSLRLFHLLDPALQRAGDLSEPRPYVTEVLDLLLFGGRSRFEQFSEWVDPILRDPGIGARGGAWLDELLNLFLWLQGDPADLQRLKRVLDFAVEKLVAVDSPLIHVIWDHLGRLPDAHLAVRIESASRLAQAAAARPALASQAITFWWELIGQSVDRLNEAGRQCLTRTLDACGRPLRFLGPELVGRMQKLATRHLMSESNRMAALGLLQYLGDRGLLESRNTPEIKEFFARWLDSDPESFAAVLHLYGSESLQLVPEGQLISGVLDEALAASAPGAVRLMQEWAGRPDLEHALQILALRSRRSWIYLHLRLPQAAQEDFVGLFRATDRDLQAMRLTPEVAGTVLAGMAQARWGAGPMTREEAQVLRKSFDKRFLEACGVAEMVEKARKKAKPAPDPEFASAEEGAGLAPSARAQQADAPGSSKTQSRPAGRPPAAGPMAANEFGTLSPGASVPIPTKGVRLAGPAFDVQGRRRGPLRRLLADLRRMLAAPARLWKRGKRR